MSIVSVLHILLTYQPQRGSLLLTGEEEEMYQKLGQSTSRQRNALPLLINDGCGVLTYLPLDNMAAVSLIIFSDAFSWMINLYFDWISPKFIPKGPIDNNLKLVQIMAWRQLGDKPLSEPTLTWITDAYMRH